MTGKVLTCCDDAYVEGTVGINLKVMAISDIINCVGLLDSDQLEGLNLDARKTIGLKNFLANNQCSGEAKAFGLLAIDAMAEGGSVDYEDRIINTLTGKADCVYKKLKGLSGDLFKKTMGTFKDDPEYDLTLQVGNCNITNDACTDATDVK